MGQEPIHVASKLALTWWQAIAAFAVDAIVLVVVSLLTKPKPEEELRGLVWGIKRREQEPDSADAHYLINHCM